MSYQRNLRALPLNIATTGNTTVIPANQLGVGIGTIRVWKIILNGGGANTITFYGGAAPLGSPIVFTAAGASATLLKDEQPYVECPPGQPLIINTTSASAVTGELWYSLA